MILKYFILFVIHELTWPNTIFDIFTNDMFTFIIHVKPHITSGVSNVSETVESCKQLHKY